ncbi:hypothetical protein KFE25_007743 [Diacronema lutheri]|uniref:Uncharacterized protein n=1 Tax=Diacronema lutheri TaxID=2081491 RepID=A0A8J5Y0U9_DIALT|nr:hypothetical protein KFE25_007743 [Diacronema lutheri]
MARGRREALAALLALAVVASRAATLATGHAGTARRCVARMGPMRPSGERKFVKKLWKSRRGSLDELELAALSGSTNRTRTSRVDEVLRAPRRIRGAESRQGVDANPREDLRLTISGGEQKGRKLRTPDAYIRPMMAQVRQAMFSMLGELTELGPSTSMLDLFSGSGCVGLEALSRGCQTVASVDFSAKCADVMRYNARACGYEDRHTTVCAKAEDVLADPARFKLRYPFDLITLTPPYEEILYADLIKAVLASPGLGENTVIALEYPEELGVLPAVLGDGKLVGYRNRKYGRTVLAIYVCRPDGSQGGLPHPHEFL